MQRRKGGKAENLRVYDSKERLLIDKELTDRTIDFMKRQESAGKPFFAFVPYTQTHLPALPHPDFKGKSGNGNWADVLMQIDSYVGRLLDAVDELGLRENTVFIFTSDNGPEFSRAWVGFSGPWRGTYFTGLEASLRVPYFYNLLLDPKEEHPSAPNVPENLWVHFPAGKILTDHAASLQKEPPIRPGTPDPYIPK